MAFERRADAERDQGKAVLATEVDDRHDIVGRLGEHHRVGCDRRKRRLVLAMMIANGLGHGIALAEAGRQRLAQVGRHRPAQRAEHGFRVIHVGSGCTGRIAWTGHSTGRDRRDASGSAVRYPTRSRAMPVPAPVATAPGTDVATRGGRFRDRRSRAKAPSRQRQSNIALVILMTRAPVPDSGSTAWRALDDNDEGQADGTGNHLYRGPAQATAETPRSEDVLRLCRFGLLDRSDISRQRSRLPHPSFASASLSTWRAARIARPWSARTSPCR